MTRRGNPLERWRLGKYKLEPARQRAQTSSIDLTTTSSRGEGILYLIRNSSLDALKIGISSASSRTDRLQVHSDEGWTVETVWNFSNRQDAATVERAIVNWWRNDLKVLAACSAEDMPQGGYSETVDSRRVTVDQVKHRVSDLITSTNGRIIDSSSIARLTPGLYMKVEGKIRAMIDVDAPEKRKNWQRWLLDDGTAQLLIEVSGNYRVSRRILDPGRQVQVVGRVKEIPATQISRVRRVRFRMVNPWYLIHETGIGKKNRRSAVSRPTYEDYPSNKELARQSEDLYRKYIEWTNRYE